MTIEELCELKEQYADEWLKYDNVYGIGVGYKIRDGKETDEIGIIVYTTKKKPKNQIVPQQVLPAFIGEVPIDVVEAPIPEPQMANAQKSKEDYNMYNPMVGGIQLCHCSKQEGSFLYLSLGTLGMFVKSKDDPDGTYILTNWHVLEKLDIDIFHPTYAGDHSDMVRVAVSTKGDYFECADAGIAKVVAPPNQIRTNEIIEIGEIRGIASERPALGQLVKKRGRTTRLTYGKVNDIDMTVSNGTNIFRHQVRVVGYNNADTAVSDGGDSGSIVLTYDEENDEKNNYVLGLLWGGSRKDDILVYSPIKYVFESLNIEMCSAT